MFWSYDTGKIIFKSSNIYDFKIVKLGQSIKNKRQMNNKAVEYSVSFKIVAGERDDLGQSSTIFTIMPKLKNLS